MKVVNQQNITGKSETNEYFVTRIHCKKMDNYFVKYEGEEI